MDGSSKRVALVAESTRNTTPATPAFYILRDTSTTGSPDRPFAASPERRADRNLGATYRGVNRYPKSFTMPLFYDTLFQDLLAATLQSSWSTNVVKNGLTPAFFTVEEKFEGGSTDPRIRTTGWQPDTFSLSGQVGGAFECQFSGEGMGESTGTSDIASSTFAAASDDDPFTMIDVTATTIFGLSSFKLMSLGLRIQNGLRAQYSAGSGNPFGHGSGRFSVTAELSGYFDTLAHYTTPADGELGDLELTIGHTANEKYTILLPNARAYNPQLSDSGNDSDIMLSMTAQAMYDSSDAASIKITRAVA